MLIKVGLGESFGIFYEGSEMVNVSNKIKVMGLVVFFTFQSCFPVIILVHGSFAVQSDWARPYGNFYQVLQQQAREHGHMLFSFCWSGQPTVREIYLGAVRLASLIETYPEDENIILIGHSHGGNVINLASRFLYEPGIEASEEIEKKWLEILEHIKVDCEPVDQKNSQVFDVTPPGGDIGLSICATTRRMQKYRIDRVYLLGTPVDTVRYKPEMDVIERVYSLYSLGDHVQTVGGMYQQTFPKDFERVYNVRVQFKNSGLLGSDDPTHSALRYPIVAQWILQLSDILEGDCVYFNSSQA